MTDFVEVIGLVNSRLVLVEHMNNFVFKTNQSTLKPKTNILQNQEISKLTQKLITRLYLFVELHEVGHDFHVVRLVVSQFK